MSFIYLILVSLSYNPTVQNIMMINNQRIFEIQVNLKKVEEVLMNLMEYGKHHPYIIGVEDLSAENESNRKFLITEKPYPKLPFKTKYTAVVRQEANKIWYLIDGLPMTNVKIDYQIDQISEERTRVTYNVYIEGTLPVKKILLNRMLKAQDLLIKSIEAN